MAAAGPALRVGDWRGRRVRVCRGDRCISVKLVDWCGCYRRDPSKERIIDLHPAAFDALGSLSEGVMRVTVSW